MEIMFVCTGNANRSAVAEVILRKLLAEKGVEGVTVASCGTGVPPGLQREKIMCDIASRHGYEMGGMAVAATPELLMQADLIIVMTEIHFEEVTTMLPYDRWDRIVMFSEYCFDESFDLPDPHRRPEWMYEKCFEVIEKGCREIVKKLA